VSLAGASMDTDKEANKKLYGKELGAKEIVTGDQPVVSAAEPLVSLLNETSPDRK
jgi:lipid-binding SYLF domain-containing protein